MARKLLILGSREPIPDRLLGSPRSGVRNVAACPELDRGSGRTTGGGREGRKSQDHRSNAPEDNYGTKRCTS